MAKTKRPEETPVASLSDALRAASDLEEALQTVKDLAGAVEFLTHAQPDDVISRGIARVGRCIRMEAMKLEKLHETIWAATHSSLTQEQRAAALGVQLATKSAD